MERRHFLAAGLTLALAPALRGAPAGPSTADAEKVEAWQSTRAALFGDRPIRLDDGAMLALEAPYRAADAAVVPVAMRALVDQTPERFVSKLYLLIDQNPTPVVGIFEFFPQSGRADVETRVRVNDYTFVRAIAEMNDGELIMTARFVKASGGCSAPAGKDPKAALISLGTMKLDVDPPLEAGKLARARLMIRHPNVTGLAMDQLTRLYPSPHYVRHVEVSYREQPVLRAEVTFGISENPSFRFQFRPQDGGVLEARAEDTEQVRFEIRADVVAPKAT